MTPSARWLLISEQDAKLVGDRLCLIEEMTSDPSIRKLAIEAIYAINQVYHSDAEPEGNKKMAKAG